MPWTKDNPPAVAKNWTDEERRRCVQAANAALADGKSDQDAIFACIAAAGKSQKETNVTRESMSLDEISRRVRDAWRAKFAQKPPADTVPTDDLWPKEVLEDQIIIETPSGLLSYPYTIGEDGAINFGEPTRVEVSYAKVSEFFQAQIAPHAHEAADGEDQFAGREWDVTIIGARSAEDVLSVDGREYILSKNGRLYATDALKESASVWDGVKVYDNHLTEEEFQQRAGMRSVAEEWIGTIVKPRWHEAKKQLRAVLKVVEEALARKLKAAWDQGILETVGLSIDSLPIVGREVVIEGRSMPVVEGFRKVLSVDLVAEPAAGGGFNRLIAAEQHPTQEANEMDDKELLDQIEQMLDQKIPSAVAEALAAREDEDHETEAEEETQDAELAEEAEDQDAGTAEEAEDQDAETEESETEAAEEGAESEDLAKEAIRRMECRIALRDKLDEAKLSPPARKLVMQAFDGRVFEASELDAFIKQAKKVDAASDPSGRVAGAGRTVEVTIDEMDKASAEFLRMAIGNTLFRSLENVEDEDVQARLARVKGYKAWITDGRPAYGYGLRRTSDWLYQYWGDPFDAGNTRFSEAITTSSMSSIVKNALNVMLAADYAKRQRWWDPIVRVEEVDTIDQATLVRGYGLDSLSVVNEGNAYTELDWVDEEETASFVKKGNYVGVTLETLLRDKVNAVRTIPNRLATSWWNTLSKLVSGVFTVNSDTGPALADTGVLFNATAVTTAGGHANLLTTALSYTAYGAARTAMMKQTDQYSGGASSIQGERLLLQPRFLLVPVDLETTAIQMRNSEHVLGSANNDINPFYQKFEIVVVPHWTDTNNWALVADPQAFPSIWLIFLRGRRVPELFDAGDERSGAMFTNDTLRYKVRLLTFRFSATYDCAPVSDFRPLHKSNVAG